MNRKFWGYALIGIGVLDLAWSFGAPSFWSFVDLVVGIWMIASGLKQLERW